MKESEAAGSVQVERPHVHVAVVSSGGAPSLGHRLPLDGIRGIAVALVLLGHTADLLWVDARSWLAPGGHLGVHLFFVLSGFLITSLLLAEGRRKGEVRLADFARRRVLRLVPALVPLLIALMVVATVGSRLGQADVWNSSLHVLTFSTNYSQMHGDVPIVSWLGGDALLVREISHTWSLSVEAHFYVIWGFSLWLLTRLRWSLGRIAALIVAATATITVVRAVAYAGSDDAWGQYYFDTWPRLDAPALGALVAVAFAAGWATRVPGRVLAWVGAAGLVAFLVAGGTLRADRPALPLGLYTVLAACAAVTVLAVVLRPDIRLAGVLSWGPLVWLGTISYSLYLWHYWIFMAAARRGAEWPAGLRVGLGIGLAVGVAWLSQRLVERPFQHRRVRTDQVVAPH